jgi:hypothetical protein
MNVAFTTSDTPTVSNFSIKLVPRTIYREVDMGYVPVRPKPHKKAEQPIGMQPTWFTFVNPLEFE